ncbi:hypothetical protein Ping_2467 [Psychromonas ingrahamii 37]|uniref:Uncharacterized protein n=1 Tax=Psychromonas ingrahamii (strain DSM 17664 / CCUG 51855 / 37) TaxID=357804 RepID=A1SXI3_PSYIN|nr:hypothetical protein [Psychromonas ingrahamii]ABM04198.1 hypothetical protein Ping_2467 [Psychromonas ingrahamii 37]
MLYKVSDRKHIYAAYYSSNNTQCYYTSSAFCLLRANSCGSNWDGKRLFLFLFLKTQAGKQLLEYTFRDFSVNLMALLRLTPRQVNLLELPQLGEDQAKKLDERFNNLSIKTNKIKELKEEIQVAMSTRI